MSVTAAKSAALAAALCHLGAQAGGVTGLPLAWYAAFGYHLGMATQLANDLAGARGAPPSATDLIRRRPTLPLVYAAHHHRDGRERRESMEGDVPDEALLATWVVARAHRSRAVRVLDRIERMRPARALLEPFLP